MTPERRRHFEMFLRNDRWGTCGECPTDTDGKKLPELCRYTERYDHQLTLDELVRLYKQEAEREAQDRRRLRLRA